MLNINDLTDHNEPYFIKKLKDIISTISVGFIVGIQYSIIKKILNE